MVPRMAKADPGSGAHRKTGRVLRAPPARAGLFSDQSQDTRSGRVGHLRLAPPAGRAEKATKSCFSCMVGICPARSPTERPQYSTYRVSRRRSLVRPTEPTKASQHRSGSRIGASLPLAKAANGFAHSTIALYAL